MKESRIKFIMKYIINIFKCIIIILFYNLQIQAQNLSLQNVNNVSITYSTVDTNGYFEPVTFQIVNSAATEEQYTVLFDEGGYSSGQGQYDRKGRKGPNRISYKLLKKINADDSNLLKDFNAYIIGLDPPIPFKNVIGSKGNLNYPTILANDSITETYYLYVIPEQAVASKKYSDDVEIKLHNLKWKQINSETDTQDDTSIVTITIDVQSFAGIELALEDASVAITNLNPGTDSRTNFDAWVFSNNGFQILVHSDNGSILKHERVDILDEINYEYRIKKIGGTYTAWADLTTSPTQVFTALIGNMPAGEEFRNQVQIKLGQDLSELMAGTYRDIITIEVQEYP